MAARVEDMDDGFEDGTGEDEMASIRSRRLLQHSIDLASQRLDGG
jgi:hypothetical protein